VAYDISSPSRLRKVAETMEAFGERLQYSVFLCDLNVSELTHLRRDLQAIMNRTADRVVIVHLGKPGAVEIEVLGTQARPQGRGSHIL
jgi:CRISPR-associated protein Cas2